MLPKVPNNYKSFTVQLHNLTVDSDIYSLDFSFYSFIAYLHYFYI